MTGRHRLLVLALCAAVLVGCGVPIDDEPTAITRTTIAPASVPPTTTAETDAIEASVYFLRDDRLERVGYQVPEEPTIGQSLGFVLEPPAEGTDPELRTAVPPGTELLGIDVSGNTVVVDLSSEINDVGGEAQKEAFAQLVFTALAFENLERVRFQIDGEPIAAPTDDGNLTVVAADNYDPPLNPR